MDLINNLVPTKIDDKYLIERALNEGINKSIIEKWHFNDKVYAKIYFKDYDVNYKYFDGRNNLNAISVICKSKFFHQFRNQVDTSFYCFAEFYTEKDFEINPIWEGIYTDE